MTHRYPGVVIGVVTDREDPANEGRVRLTFPWLSEDVVSGWAPIATLMSGGERGSYFMPEIDDEVLVAFEHGDFDHPFVVGFLWNGEQVPPHSDIEPSVRRLRTVSGHNVEFDDRDGEERILIQTAGGHEIELYDPSDTAITIKTTGGHEIRLDDSNSKVTVKTSGSHQLELDDSGGAVTLKTTAGQELAMSDRPASASLKTTAGQQLSISDMPPSISIGTATGNSITADATGISVQAAAGMVQVQCIQANLTAAAMLNITAPITVFNGMVKVPLVLADAVVSSAYTPAPGNLFGL